MKKVIIVGGGISGLAAGVHALKAGYKPLIVEKNHSAGGLCTAWDRQGMHIDGCIHWMTGTNPHTSVYHEWKKAGGIRDDQEFIYLPNWGSYKYEGTTITFWKDLDRTEKEWSEISPQDSKRIHRFIKMVKKIESVDLPLDAPAILLPWKIKWKFFLQLLKVWPTYLFSMKKSCEGYAKKFKHPSLRWAISHAQPGKGNLYSMVFSYATIASGNGGIPKGGSLTLVNNMLSYYLENGGEILFNSEVVDFRFNEENDEIQSIILKNGKEIFGDTFITCLDSNHVLINLLHNKFTHKKIVKRYREPAVHPAPSCVLINYKIPASIDINNPTNFAIAPFKLGNKIIDHMNMRSYRYDDYFIKDGFTVLQVLLDQDSTDYTFWEELGKNREKYLRFKDELAEKIKNIIIEDNEIFRDNIELLDVATPLTLHRYVNASRGSYMSYLFNQKKMVINTKGKIKGIKNLLLSGQYVQTPGGLPLALASGSFSIKWLQHEDKKHSK